MSLSSSIKAIDNFSKAFRKMEEDLRGVSVSFSQKMDVVRSQLDGFQGSLSNVSDTNRTTFTDILQLGKSMKLVAPVASKMSLSLKETAVMADMLANSGHKGSLSGTALHGMLVALNAPSSEARKHLEALGIQTSMAEGKIVNMADVLDQLNTKLAGMSEAEKIPVLTQIFGEQGVPSALVFMDGLAKKVDGLSKKDFSPLSESLKDVEKSVALVAETMTDNLGGSITKLVSSMEGLSNALGQSLSQKINEIFSKNINSVREWIGANQALVGNLVLVGSTAMAIFDAVSMLVSVFFTLKSTVSGVIAVFTTLKTIAGMIGIFSMLKSTVLGVTMVFTTLKTMAAAIAVAVGGISLPVWGVVAAVAALAVAAYLIYDNWEKLQEWWLNMWSSIKNVLSSVGDWITEKIKSVFDIGKTIGSHLIENHPIAMLGQKLLDIYDKITKIKDFSFSGTIKEILGIKNEGKLDIELSFRNPPQGVKAETNFSGNRGMLNTGVTVIG